MKFKLNFEKSKGSQAIFFSKLDKTLKFSWEERFDFNWVKNKREISILPYKSYSPTRSSWQDSVVMLSVPFVQLLR